jgi:hypothetical protein
LKAGISKNSTSQLAKEPCNNSSSSPAKAPLKNWVN